MDLKTFNKIFENSELVGDKIKIKTDILTKIKCLKENYGFNILKEIIAIDTQDGFTELIYHLFSTHNFESVKLSTLVTSEADSISEIFKSAIADENEIYDLFGIKFTGNKNLKRLYMPDSWIGHPLKKDYKNTDERLRWND
jgi:NADH:ubiquinone oxidoreductase subunit C